MGKANAEDTLADKTRSTGLIRTGKVAFESEKCDELIQTVFLPSQSLLLHSKPLSDALFPSPDVTRFFSLHILRG